MLVGEKQIEGLLAGLESRHADRLVQDGKAVESALEELQKTEYNSFCEAVLKDERSGMPLQQAWIHEVWTEIRRRHKRAIIISHVGAGKTQQFSIGVILHELAKNNTGRFITVSRTHKQAIRIIRSTARYIEKSPELHRLYPDLLPGDKWSDEGLFVQREGNLKDPSLQALGYKGAVSGARCDGAMLDDFLDSTNTRTKARRDDTETWYFSEIESRMEEDAFVYFVGNAWDPDDLYHRLERRGWPTYRFPVVVTHDLLKTFPWLGWPLEEGGYNLKLGDPTWKEKWSLERIEQRRAILTPLEFARVLMCEARDSGESRFKREWLDAALEKGADFPVMHSLEELLLWDDPYIFADIDLNSEDAEEEKQEILKEARSDWWVISGVDLSTGESDDLTVITTIAVNRLTKKRFVLYCESGKWQVDQIIQRIKQTFFRYQSVFLVENNATQAFIIQLLQKTTAIPVYPYTTTRVKYDPSNGIELMAAEFFNEKWVIPSKNGVPANEEFEHLVDEVSAYTGDPKEHTGDRMMSLWFAQIMARRFELKQLKDNEDAEESDGSDLLVI